MAKNINVQQSHWANPDKLEVELAERKGVGHPDYIADSASEEASRKLSLYYLKAFGTILHHNLDKTLVVGGQATPKYKGGDVVQPIYVIVSGRATTEVKTPSGVENIPIGTIIIESVKDWIKENFRYLDVEKHVVVDYKIGKGSTDLVGLFEANKQVPLSNDTSFGVGFAPYSTLENLVLSTERLLNSKEIRSKIPEIGEDIKVMGLRKGKEIELTVAMATISQLIDDLNHYLQVKEEAKQKILDLASKLAPEYSVKVNINTGDKIDKGIVYLTVTGTSAEHGDDGMTGRGNRATGLITPMRPMSLEATAGKNPVNHVGKLYNVLANLIAQKVHKDVKGINGVQVEILGQIGRPINDPLIANVQLAAENITTEIKREVEGITDELLSSVTKLSELILESKTMLF
ncbi:methionine adenosyltransferase [Sulfolobus acidocaldarius]|uniref:S-adenosylmethionine synthase n=4 Tax=Sulfolobus acidocaldarius TaxID=2285 RepID=METK_SULAC|nr:methionine adenosyltransferase [Sulfolobus acidocaldarius]Q4JAL1.1 RecName: Full=S-adenosylmethionine synthase; Short=AdoMet synthase; AltName: Full=Methionine adenosyltransferase [Sulfolobus acidocaldarius DSM 639]AAY80168.1 S-adenosylmethionine synthetase [Sulfolobus acidocaldarius DSM 639]AGE70746.1 S-adenosylmethionine synthetase [Sulfolobus acidocaldarius N8]AGE73017.1 S-adenosylmethionine synthetase [Sulfolobus acidocaldarius Ron12/I]ALU28922.1 S-adenosylmethionine synthetase [Sulfolo